MDKSSSTIKEVASKSGVSIGTVDRVLHNRSGVSSKSREKVLQAIKELKYEANPHAAILASKKTNTIATILPKFIDGDYWSKVYEGFNSGVQKMLFSNIHISVFVYDQYDPLSFRKATEDLLSSSPSAVIIPTLFERESQLLAQHLSEKKIPYMIIDSYFEAPDSLAYYGAPLYKSGQLAAYLMTLRSKPTEIVVFRIMRDAERLADPTRNRRIGFIDYLGTMAPECMIYNIFLKPDDELYNEGQIEDFFSLHPNVKHIVMFNSRLYLLEKYLSSHPDSDRQVLGFANLESNLNLLRRKLATFLICWKPERQSELAIEAMSSFLVMGKIPIKKNNYMHMDVLTEMNTEDY